VDLGHVGSTPKLQSADRLLGRKSYPKSRFFLCASLIRASSRAAAQNLRPVSCIVLTLVGLLRGRGARSVLERPISRDENATLDYSWRRQAARMKGVIEANCTARLSESLVFTREGQGLLPAIAQFIE
jgi:hypothetical protein